MNFPEQKSERESQAVPENQVPTTADSTFPECPDPLADDALRSPSETPTSSAKPSAGSEAVSEEASNGSVLPEFQPVYRQMLKYSMGFLLVVLAVEWILIATDRPDPVLIQRGAGFQQHFRIEVNSATWIEWLQMEGIGQSLAHRIVADRKLNGPFKSIDDVGRVPGIGPATLDRIRPWLTIRHDISQTQSFQTEPIPHTQQPGE